MADGMCEACRMHVRDKKFIENIVWEVDDVGASHSDMSATKSTLTTAAKT
jgi:hypothetical protein